MPRRARDGSAGLIFHVINRGAKRAPLFAKFSDYEAFEKLLIETGRRVQISLLSYCLMPNHWHLVLWPEHDGDLSRYMQRLTFVHALRWNAWRGMSGTGAVYQGRFKAIPVQDGTHFIRLCRYVERNPLRAGLASGPTDWRWCSAWRRAHAQESFLAPWPVPVPENWASLLREDQVDSDLEAVRRAININRPYGESSWSREIAVRLGLESPHGRGRPKTKGVGYGFRLRSDRKSYPTP